MHPKVDSVALLDAANESTAAATPKKIGFVSLGCPKNLVDSEVMMGLLAQGGAEITPRAEDADIIVVNTCSFIDRAKQESVDTILEMAQHKIAGKAQKLIVAGCLVERYRNEIQNSIPEVDAVVGTGELRHILSAAGIAAPRHDNSSLFVILNSRPEGDVREASGRFSKEGWDGAIADLPNYLYDENTPRLLATPKHSLAALRIGDRRGAATGQPRGPRDHAHRTGHHLLWRRSRPEGRPGAAARTVGANRRVVLGAFSLRVSQQDHRQAAG